MKKLDTYFKKVDEDGDKESELFFSNPHKFPSTVVWTFVGDKRQHLWCHNPDHGNVPGGPSIDADEPPSLLSRLKKSGQLFMFF